MNYILSIEQQLQLAAEKSRKHHDKLADLDKQLRDLESEPGAMPLAEYHERRQAIIALRAA